MSDAPADEEFDTMMEVERNPCGAWRAIQAQAAELTRLRSNVEAADKLAEAGRDARETILHFVHARWSEAEGSDEDYVGELTAALSAYEETRK